MPKDNSKQKILLTGGAGFIGSHVAECYLNEGWEVVIVDDLSTGKEKNIPAGALFYKADICDASAMEKIFRKEKPAVVNHHAAQIDVRFSVAHPEEDARKNILGGLGLLELSRKYGVQKWIYASSGGALYGEVPNEPARENTLIQPLSPYGTSKYCLEKYIELYFQLYQLNTTILRYANVYGPRQIPKAEGGVVARFVDRMSQKERPTIFGDGNQERDFVYVEDIARANVLALPQGERERPSIINIGTGKTTTINTLFQLLKKELNFQENPIFGPKRPGEIFRSVLDGNLAEKRLGWGPSISLNEGLRKTIHWTRTLPVL